MKKKPAGRKKADEALTTLASIHFLPISGRDRPSEMPAGRDGEKSRAEGRVRARPKQHAYAERKVERKAMERPQAWGRDGGRARPRQHAHVERKAVGGGGDNDGHGEKVPTGIPGLDEVMGGGFERNSVNVIRGGTGTGKTIFCLQFLYNGVMKYKEPGIYLSFAEQEKSVMRTAKSINCDLEAGNDFAFIRHSPHEVDRILKEGGGTIRDMIDSIGAKRLVIDSLTAYSLFFDSAYRRNEGVLALMDILKSWNVTTLVTDEADVDLRTLEAGRLGFLSDSLLHMYYLRTDSVRVRGIEIVKMRHTPHAAKVLPFKIENKGIVVYPNSQLLL